MTCQPLIERRKKKKIGKLYSEQYWREQPPFTCRFDTPTQLHHFCGVWTRVFIETVTSNFRSKISYAPCTKTCTLARITSRENNKQRGKQSKRREEKKQQKTRNHGVQ